MQNKKSLQISPTFSFRFLIKFFLQEIERHPKFGLVFGLTSKCSNRILQVFRFISSTDAEYILLVLKKKMTSIVHKIKDNSKKTVGIYRVSEEGSVVGTNLDGWSYCQMCESATMSYAHSAEHSTQFQCFRMTTRYAIPCPICAGLEFTWINDFFAHVRTQHIEVLERFTNDPPEDMTYKSYVEAQRRKVLTMMWMVQLFKKIIKIEGATSKPFLPLMSSSRITSCVERRSHLLCPWPICVIVNDTDNSHKHGFETDDFGKCRWCGNWHQGRVKTGATNKACAKHAFRGTLPM